MAGPDGERAIGETWEDGNGILWQQTPKGPVPISMKRAQPGGTVTGKDGSVITYAGNVDYSNLPDWLARLYLPKEPSGGTGRTVFPWEREGAEIQNALARLRLETYPEDRAMERDIGYGNLDIARGRLGLDTELGRGKLDLERLIAAEGTWAQRAADLLGRGQLEESKRAAMMQEQLASQRQELQRRLGEAESQRGDLRANLERNEAFGYVVDPVGTGVDKGTLTASERQRRTSNAMAQSQQMFNRSQAEEAQRRQAAEFAIGLRERGRAQEFAAGQAEDQARRADLALKLQAMRRPAAQVTIAPPMGPQRRFA